MNYQLALTKQDIEDYIKDSKLLALDIETSPTDKYRNEPKASLDAHKATITGISFSVSKNTGIYVPFRHRVGLNADVIPTWEWIKQKILMNRDLTVVIHNASFETIFFYALGLIPQCKIYDTLSAAQLTLKTKTEFRKLSDCGLKKLVPELIGVELPTFSEVVSRGVHQAKEGTFQRESSAVKHRTTLDDAPTQACFDELNSQDFETIRYACADSDYTLQLYEIINKWFDTYLPKHRDIAEKIESPTSVYVGLMKYNGVHIDLNLMEEKKAEANARISKLKEDISTMTNGVDIGSNASTKAFKNYLYQTLKLPVLKSTKKSNEAVDDETMILLCEWCEKNKPELASLFLMVQEYRKWSKLKSTYIDGYLKFINTETNKIHSDFLPLATETGRFVSRNPNLQNCPRKDHDPIGVRNFIVAPKGKVLLSLDFSQIELRVGAFYCRDPKMLYAYKNGGDIHAQTTSVIFNIPFSQASDKNANHYKEKRTIAKNCNFGVFFGLFPKGLQKTLKFKAGLNKTFYECTEIIKNLKSGYQELEPWQIESKKKASIRGYTESYLGRRRYLPNINSADWGKKSFAQRCALNTPIQGTAADILKLAMTRIIKGLPERLWLKPLLQIHDELVFEVPEEKIHEALTFVKKCMETKPFDAMDVPIVAEAEVGKSFGTLSNKFPLPNIVQAV